MKKLFIFLILILVFPVTLSAQETPGIKGYKSLTGIEEVSSNLFGPQANQGQTGLGILVNQIFFVVLAIAVVLAVFSIIRGGYLYVTSADNAFKKQEAKNKIWSAFGGLLLAFGTVLILGTINRGLVDFVLFFKPLKPPTEVTNDGSGGEGSGSGGTGTSGEGYSSFGGPGDVRISSDGYALQYCNKTYGGNVGSFVEETRPPGSNKIYRWCYALDGPGNKIPFSKGSRVAHGGYFETGSVSGQRFYEMSGDYVAYPLSGGAFGGLPNAADSGSANKKLKNMRVEITLEDGRTVVAPIADRGPYKARAETLDVSPQLSETIKSSGGISNLRLIDANGNTVSNDIR